MSNELDIEEFLKLRSQLSDESRRMEDLVIAYKDTTPNVTPSWDLTPNSFQFNDICPEILTSGMEIYLAPTGDVWSGIFEPAIYEKDTLWKSCHDSKKIARVIKSWANNMPLSPLFFVKHEIKDMALVADGKHRLTVARYMGCKEIPFMVQSNKSSWVEIAIPTAKKI